MPGRATFACGRAYLQRRRRKRRRSQALEQGARQRGVDNALGQEGFQVQDGCGQHCNPAQRQAARVARPAPRPRLQQVRHPCRLLPAECHSKRRSQVVGESLWRAWGAIANRHRHHDVAGGGCRGDELDAEPVRAACCQPASEAHWADSTRLAHQAEEELLRGSVHRQVQLHGLRACTERCVGRRASCVLWQQSCRMRAPGGPTLPPARWRCETRGASALKGSASGGPSPPPSRRLPARRRPRPAASPQKDLQALSPRHPACRRQSAPPRTMRASRLRPPGQRKTTNAVVQIVGRQVGARARSRLAKKTAALTGHAVRAVPAPPARPFQHSTCFIYTLMPLPQCPAAACLARTA